MAETYLPNDLYNLIHSSYPKDNFDEMYWEVVMGWLGEDERVVGKLDEGKRVVSQHMVGQLGE